MTAPAAFTARQTAAVMVVGVIGVLIPGLQPQLLGALLAEAKLSTNALGLLATAELLAMGIAAGTAGLLLSVGRLRLIAAAALMATAALDLGTPFVSGGGLFAARIAAGLAEGVLIWIAIGLIVRARRPERWSGIYLALQTVAQLALATAMGLAVIPRFGSAGGFTLLALVTALGLAALPLLPRAYADLDHGDAAGSALPARGIIALAGVTLYLAFIVSVWVYIEPLGLQRGIDAATVRLVAPLSLAMQVAGAAVAAMLAGRLPARAVVSAIAMANLVLLAVMAAPPSASAFVIATALFGFLWLFAMPFQVPILIAADPSRRAAMLIGGAQLIGSSLGPFIAAFLVSDRDVGPVLWFGAACAAAGTIALVGARVGRSAAAPRPA
ncbi:MFS transporter [Sphingopyxis sp. OPL5]|uniref:MFS transporter n=1 Tax=Sphingopyxis sp. OPL5 TaxID=2486273 RepID=UPI00164CE615|nr:MFS transporter [Sphingopyxis sp. OPL5]QNO27478.1 MFS transporter [Sphingopyxis sp. OPL5]